jgi:glycosyltransferase involved in cell wall biosynthesis
MRRIPETDALYPDDLFKKVEGDSPEELAELLRQDLENEAAISERAARARRFLVENYGPEIFLRKISEQIREAAVIGQE